jgi:hypothetical protein
MLRGGNMEALAIIGGLASMLMSLIVGARLIRLAQRTRQSPELLLGLSLVLLGCFWSALAAIGRQAVALPDATRVDLLVFGALCAIGGNTSLAIFNVRVFRSGSSWAKGLSAALALAMLGLLAAQTLGPGWVLYAHAEQGPWTCATWVGAATYAWSSIEAWRQLDLLARRARIGLADPVVTNRVLLWTITMVTALVATLAFSALQAWGIPVGGTTLGLGLGGFVSLVSAGCLWLAFMPPSSYLASVRRRAPAAA